MAEDTLNSSPFDENDIEKTWQALDEYLTTTRYAVRDPETGKALEKNYQSMMAGRIIPGLTKGPNPLPDSGLMEELVQALQARHVIPASPILMSFGNPHTRRHGYYSCYPLGCVGDSMAEIDDMRQRMRTIYMAGGGAGLDISKLRPKGASVDAGQGIASGPVGFLADFDAVTGTTSQGGRRKGALLVQMDWNHPDIKDFIKAKNFNAILNRHIQNLPKEERPSDSPLRLSSMNISVNIFGDFWEQDGLIRLIAENMWNAGDPGLLFIDNMLKYSPLKEADEPRFSNPCGEYLASAGSACNLVTVNAARLARITADQLLKEGFKPASPEWTNKFCSYFWPRLSRAAGLACYLGNLILMYDEGFPLPEIRERTQALKPVGVGMSGFHTALILAYFGHSAYGDKTSIDFAGKTQAALTLGTLNVSAELARKTGHVYENSGFWLSHLSELSDTLSDSPIGPSAEKEIESLTKLVEEKGGFHNCLTTSQPPTGTVSVFLRIIDTGIEPFFSLNMSRKISDPEKGWITCSMKPYDLHDLFEKFPALKERTEAQTTFKLTPTEQIMMLAAFQRHNHTGVSKTINVPNSTTPEQIEDLICLSRDMRLKGFTVFRDGSMPSILSVSPQGSGAKPKYSDDNSGVANERGGRLYTARGLNLKAHVTLTNDEDKNIREVFVKAGDVGADINALFSAFGMILSTSLKYQPELFDNLVKTLKKVQMGDKVKIQTASGKLIVGDSLPQAIGLLMSHRKAELDKEPVPAESPQSSFDLCPECHSLTLQRDGSCRKCHNCGYTTC
ncbi:MAG: hypothetical protein LBJ64_06020 [Deltaproteobacteria bacterium]|jgi:ribonucleoside-diphosphate reductase alpha chain|nr:hypothetical protein [Deltaproteobacteria bacterium]